MTDFPAHLAPARGRQPRSTSNSSPARQPNTDDLLSNLTPRTVLDAFRNPSGTLKDCIEAATPAEQAFALRVAIASNNIHEWLEELSAWPWPTRGGSTGFEMPAVKRRRLSNVDHEHTCEGTESRHADDGYIGSLPEADVAKYERRIDEISQALEELDIEEIKTQVLNNHIMPLSRPGTPVLNPERFSMSSLSGFAKMDDMTALITAATVQALPKLSKLTRLMTAWNFRLLVLRKIPVFLESIVDAEVALQSGWNAISLGAHGQNGTSGTRPATLSREEFDVMKSVLGRKVAKTGRDLDAMLDILEGQPDTLPEEWIDKVDTLEHGYGEWTVACEKKIKEADLARMAPKAATAKDPGTDGNVVAAPPPAVKGSQERGPAPLLEGSTLKALEHQVGAPTPVIKIHPTAEEETRQPVQDNTENDHELSDGTYSAETSAKTLLEPAEVSPAQPEKLGNSSQSDSDTDMSDSSAPSERPEEGVSRRGSDASQSSTVLHGAASTFTDSFSSDLSQDSPARPRLRSLDCEGDVSPLQSFRSSTRSMSVSFAEKPTINEFPTFPSPPSTPRKQSIAEEDLPTEPNTPVEMAIPAAADDQLQQQISEILESVPAKIRLTAEPRAINLNPPDFKMPKVRRTSKSDAIPRSQSNLSMRSAYSRSGTPSFTLAPAYGRSYRQRHQRGNQEIKLYHLSRSNGEAPIKLFIRCVGEHNERVMVRVGGGWADLGEYLKEYATHHLRRSAASGPPDGKVEVKDVPRNGPVRADATPPSRPASAMDAHSPVSPLKMRKTRRPAGPAPPSEEASPAAVRPKTPLASMSRLEATPPSDGSSSRRSRSSSRISWEEEDGKAVLGMAGPRAKKVDMSEESRAWVECVKEKVRIASGGPPPSASVAPSASASSVGSVNGKDSGNVSGNGNGGLEASLMDRSGAKAPSAMFGEMGKVGSTKRLFRRG
ncbi:hypothetical protein VTI74DRAFT_5685 [Chaetomium olivicolor]